MLDYSAWNNAYGLSVEDREAGYKEYILSELLKRQQYLNYVQGEIRMKTYEADLIEKDIVSVVKEDMSMNYGINIFAGFNADTLLHEVWLTFTEHFNELDEEKQKSYKSSLEFVKTIISRAIFGNDPEFELVDMIMYNFGESYWFKYKYREVELQLSVPVFLAANQQNYTRMIAGYTLYYKTGSNKAGGDDLNILITDLDYTKIRRAFHKWYSENYTVKKKVKGDQYED